MTDRGILLAGLAIAVIGRAPSGSLAAIVDFQSIPRETPLVFGGAFGNTPGDPVLSQDGIEVSVENFLLGSFVGFYRAQVGGRYESFFSTRPLDLDNISVEFDFSQVGFAVTNVTLEFQEFGGADNFSVNGSTLYEVLSLPGIPSTVAPDVTASVDHGLITLSGPIDRFRIGGQELAIDNIIATPEPATVILLALAGVLLGRRPSGCKR